MSTFRKRVAGIGTAALLGLLIGFEILPVLARVVLNPEQQRVAEHQKMIRNVELEARRSQQERIKLEPRSQKTRDHMMLYEDIYKKGGKWIRLKYAGFSEYQYRFEGGLGAVGFTEDDDGTMGVGATGLEIADEHVHFCLDHDFRIERWTKGTWQQMGRSDFEKP